MSQEQDTVELLDERIRMWADACRGIGTQHGREIFRKVQAVMEKLAGRDGWGRPTPSTYRVLPRPFLIEWATEIAKARWRISPEWFAENGLTITYLDSSSRIIKAQRAGHNEGVDRAATFAKMPQLMRTALRIGVCNLGLFAAMWSGKKAA